MLGRYLFLVLDGDSWFGKTKYALSLQPLGRTYYCDCTAGISDLRDFDVRRAFAEGGHQIEEVLTIVERTSDHGCVANHGECLHGARLANENHCVYQPVDRRYEEMRKVDRNWLAKNSVYLSVKELLWVEPPRGLPVPHNIFYVYFIFEFTVIVYRQRMLQK